MKTVIINGSPRKNGFTAKIIEYIQTKINCEVIDCFDGANHCLGCDKCSSGVCVINDKMQDYYKKIEQADAVIFASPLYFSMLTGGFLTFASRWQYFYLNQYKGEKKGGVILIGGGSTKDISKAYQTAKIIMRYVGISNPPLLDFIDTDNQNPLENSNFIDKLDNFIQNFK